MAQEFRSSVKDTLKDLGFSEKELAAAAGYKSAAHLSRMLQGHDRRPRESTQEQNLLGSR